MNRWRAAYFGIDNKPILLDEGYHKVRRRLDGYGRVIEITYVDLRGAPVVRTAGYAKLQKGYDMYGRPSEEAIFAPDGSPVAMPSGEHKWVKQYDDRGRVVEQRWFGARNEAVQISGNGRHYTRYAYDDLGNTIEIAHFDVRGNPVLGPDPTDTRLCSLWRAEYDPVGKMLSTECVTATAPERRKNTAHRARQP